jgi:hypothetical protein
LGSMGQWHSSQPIPVAERNFSALDNFPVRSHTGFNEVITGDFIDPVAVL